VLPPGNPPDASTGSRGQNVERLPPLCAPNGTGKPGDPGWGCSNSPNALLEATPSESGIDTFSLSWQFDVAGWQRPWGARDGAAGAVTVRDQTDGSRLLFWPEHGRVAIEGRLGAVIDGSSESHRLGSELDLAEVVDLAEARAGRHVALHAGTCGVRRLDIAGELMFPAGTGTAMLEGLAA
jgi:hypothetical protein